MLNGSDVGQLRRCQERTWHILRSASSRSADFSSLLHRCPSRAARNAPERHVAQIHCPCFFNFLYESSCIAHSATVFTRHAANEESAGHNLQHAVGRTRGGTARYRNTRSKNLPAPAAGARAATLHAVRSTLGSRRGLGGERAERGRLCNLPCAPRRLPALSARPCSHQCFPPCGDTFHNHDANTKTLR